MNEDDFVVISHVPGIPTARRVIDEADSPPLRRLRSRPTKTVKRLMYKATKQPKKKTTKEKNKKKIKIHYLNQQHQRLHHQQVLV